MSKSFTSTAVGLAIAEGKLTIDDSVLAAFPDDAPERSQRRTSRRCGVRDLLRMSAGHQAESKLAADVLSAKTFLAHPVPFKPGTHFLYNTPATFMASAMVQKATGQSVLEYLKPRLFEPLGIANPTWDANFQGISLGGYGLSLRTEDIAKFGQLYPPEGAVERQADRSPPPGSRRPRARQTSNGSNPKSDWEQGYGYQFWRCRNGAYPGRRGLRPVLHRACPSRTPSSRSPAAWATCQGVLNLVWDKLLPALNAGAISEDPEAARKLQDKLKVLTIRKPKGPSTSPTLAQVGGKTYAFPSNDKKLESVRVEAGSNPGEVAIITRTDGRTSESRSPASTGRRESSPPPRAGITPAQGTRNIAAIGAWTADDTYTARVVLYETPFVLTMTLRFAGDDLFYDSQVNVRGKDPQLVGRRQ